VVDVGEEEVLVDGDVGDVLVGGEVGGALIEVPFPAYMGIIALLLVVSFPSSFPSCRRPCHCH
jgi:hypothetical protein